MTDDSKKEPWYHSKKVLVMAFVAVGPLALPLLWMNPKISLFTKVVWTVIAVAITWWLIVLSIDTYKRLMQQLRDLGLIQAG